MLAVSEAERKNIEQKVRLFLGAIGVAETEKAVSAAINLVEPIHIELNAKADSRDLREILLEIKALREDTNKRFEDIQRYMDRRFEAMDRRFEAMDKRFEDMQRYMDKRFSMLQWSIGIGFLIISIVTPLGVGLLLRMLT